MADTGALSPWTCADDSAVWTGARSNPDNAKISDNVYAYAQPGIFGFGYNLSHYLKATNFGFTIPVGATIVGIKIEVEKKCWNSNYP